MTSAILTALGTHEGCNLAGRQASSHPKTPFHFILFLLPLLSPSFFSPSCLSAVSKAFFSVETSGFLFPFSPNFLARCPGPDDALKLVEAGRPTELKPTLAPTAAGQDIPTSIY
ncbi:hypothetical protein LX32DRAFT_160914 [Colletotrichum zoysiae]|uniref:Uncharacterized protein n=1 Tax=Colletotrichum zoysiae TaxID=1216348 RepID=A0AAD9H6A2_9PEZI|nr:hypothetical protein LX32DRAFT_160914 [Colletotrichum zoysiae]